MKIDRFMAIRDHLLHQSPLDPPLTVSELATILIYAEHFLRFADALKEA